jgi:hypothetical protein
VSHDAQPRVGRHLQRRPVFYYKHFCRQGMAVSFVPLIPEMAKPKEVKIKIDIFGSTAYIYVLAAIF